MLKSTIKSTCLWLAALTAMCVLWMIFNAQIGVEYPNPIASAAKCIGDFALILLPYWLLRPPYRWTIAIPVWGYSLWAVGNMAYFRFWGDFIPPSAFLMSGNVNGNLLSYGIALLHPIDCWFLIIPLALSVLVPILKPGKEPGYTPKFKASALAACLTLGIAAQASYLVSHSKWNASLARSSTSELAFQHFLVMNPSTLDQYATSGTALFGVQFVGNAIRLANYDLTLSDAEKDEIDSFIAQYSHRFGTIAAADTMNVVYIIVESLNADVLGKEISGLAVVPTLDSLSALPGTVLADNVVPQIAVASSSDGQLTLLTGLLPTAAMPYCFSFGNTNTFRSIADVLDTHPPYVLIADDGRMWNKINVINSFHLGELHTINDMHDSTDEHGRDGAMFRHAAAMMDTIRQPFVMTMMTMSMHVPFHEPAWQTPAQFAADKDISDLERNYYTVCHGFDSYLGEFLTSLPPNTMVFITSDHTVPAVSDAGAMFMALNCGRSLKISRTVGQVNLYPAILELLGKEVDGYGGLAPSALNPCVTGAVDAHGEIRGAPSAAAADTMRQAWRTSEKILRGDYFKTASPPRH